MAWRRISEFPNYLINEQGEVKNKVSGKILSISYSTRGHAGVTLFVEGRRHYRALDRLVLRAFVGAPPIRTNVTYIPMHLDGYLDNCHVDNLRWAPRTQVYVSTRGY